MGNKPSDKSRRHREVAGLNITPLMDIVTNLMFFLMMFITVAPVALIDAPLPKVASTAEEVRKALEQDAKLEVNVYVNAKGLSVKTSLGGDQSFAKGADGKYPFDTFHKYLITLHQRKPEAKEITLMPSDDVIYDVLIQVMDSARELVNGDPGYKPVPPEIAQKPESLQFNRLFPDVTIGGV